MLRASSIVQYINTGTVSENTFALDGGFDADYAHSVENSRGCWQSLAGHLVAPDQELDLDDDDNKINLNKS